MNSQNNNIPLVNKNQELQEVYKIELEAFNFLNKAVEKLDQEVLVLKERIKKLEEARD